MTDSMPLLLFSDLDGTLLDHDSYDFAPARPALDALKGIGAGVVLATSKTAAEVTPVGEIEVLNEFDDPEIRAALRTTYRRFARWIEERVVEHRLREPSAEPHPVGPADAAWAAVALGTIINIGRDLEFLTPEDRGRLLDRVGRLLLDPLPSTKRSD